MGQRKEYIQRFELSKYGVEELLDYRMIIENSFFKNKSKSEIDKLLGTLAIAVVMKLLGFSKAISGLASAVKQVADDLDKYETRALQTSFEDGCIRASSFK